jgi:Ala-tRNA(Pro) deacylase
MNQKLWNLLEENNVEFETISHFPAFTAQEVAASSHISGKEIAKTVMVKIDGKMVMAVLPASNMINYEDLVRVAGGERVEIASEDEFKDVFPDCALGAMSPFGNLYGLDVYVEKTLSEDTEIAFNACSYDELVKLSYKDFEKLVKPKVAEFSDQHQ